MTRKIIIDTDPGQDDAVAILLALASPEDFDVLGVVAVNGNVGLAQNAKNALTVVELSGRTDIPVYAGCERPMRRPLVSGAHVHGPTGLDGPDLPEPTLKLQEQHGVDFIIDTLRREESGSVTLCTLGPLTNIAMALVKAPDIAARVRELVMMGGAYFEVGNITPAAEFNIYVDPEAADIVFRAGVPLVVVPLDVTHKALTSRAWIEGLRAMGTRVGSAVAGLTDFFERFDMAKYGSQGAPLHDACVIGYLLKPGLFTGRHINVTVETTGAFTTGMTVADWWRVTGREPNAMFLGGIDRDGFYEILTERLARL